MAEGSDRAAMDPTVVGGRAGEIHAKLLEAEDALREDHEARAALILSECIDDMSDLTGMIDQL